MNIEKIIVTGTNYPLVKKIVYSTFWRKHNINKYEFSSSTALF